MSSDWLQPLLALLLSLPIPVLLVLVLRKLLRERIERADAAPPGLANAGDRVPRRPRPLSGAGAVALALPEEDHLSDAG